MKEKMGDQEEEIDNDLICYECNEKIKQDAIMKHNCFLYVENIYFSGRYAMKKAMLYDNDASQTAANKKNENKHDNNTLAARMRTY